MSVPPGLDAAFATGMTDGMEVSYKQLDGVLGEILSLTLL
jgi:hypothetical protein